MAQRVDDSIEFDPGQAARDAAILAELEELRAERDALEREQAQAQGAALKHASAAAPVKSHSRHTNLSTVQIAMPPKLVPLFLGAARYRVSYGGRGSGKTRTFAKMTAVRAYQMAEEGRSGIILCGREFQNSLEESSFAEVKAAIESEPWLAAYFEIGETYIRTKNRRIHYVFAGMRHNIQSLKSKAKILLAWVDEAEHVSANAWSTFIPSVREDGSEIWVTYNPELENSATNQRFRIKATPDMKVVELNWRDNPYFPLVLNGERVNDKRQRPEEYAHVWGGDYKTVFKGAYFKTQLLEAKLQGRITNLARDPLMSTYAFFDIGGTGAKADAVAIWIVQFVGMQTRLLRYYEAVGQELSVHVTWLRDNGYARCEVILPHDGANHEKIYDITYESALTDAGFSVTVVPNQGQGAAMARIQAARRLFPAMLFDEIGCRAGLLTIAAYHEKWDDERGIGLGPNHNYASHGADAFGLIAVAKAGGYIYGGIKPVDMSKFVKKGRA